MSCSAGFQQILQRLLSEEGGWDSGAASLLPPFLLLLFGVGRNNAAILLNATHQVLVPLTVKVTTVIYGHPARPSSHSAYQVKPNPSKM